MKSLFTGFHNPSVTDENQGRKNGEDANQTDNHTFCQRKAHIRSEFEAHETQTEQSGKGGQRASCDRRKGCGNRFLHRGQVVRLLFLFLGIPVHQEDGIVHGKHQLHDAHDGIRIFGDTGEYHVRPQIDQYRDADIDKEYHRFKPGPAHKQQNQQNQSDRNHDHMQRKQRHVRFVNASVRGDAVTVVLPVNRVVQVGGFLRVAVVFRCDLVQRITAAVIHFTRLPGYQDRLFQAGKPFVYAFLFTFRQSVEHDPQLGGRGISELLLHPPHALFHARILRQVFRQVIVDPDLPDQQQRHSRQDQKQSQKDTPMIHQKRRRFLHDRISFRTNPYA